MTTTQTASTAKEPIISNKFSLPSEWINNEMKMMRTVELLQSAIVDLSRNAAQIITWSEMIQEGIDEMQRSITVSNLETSEEQPDPEDLEQQEENETNNRM